jgi:hypothetical protein
MKPKERNPKFNLSARGVNGVVVIQNTKKFCKFFTWWENVVD